MNSGLIKKLNLDKYNKVIYHLYKRTNSDIIEENDYVVNEQYDVINTIKKLEKYDIASFIKNKTVVDGGSGIGRFLTFISFYKPLKIISVEQDIDLIKEQQEFIKSKFLFLPNKKICQNIDFYNEIIESFVDRPLNYDTICFVHMWHFLRFEEILKKISADLLIFTRFRSLNNLYELLNDNNYMVKTIDLCTDERDIFIIAKKILDSM
jgi:hypothetical protein